MESLSKEAQELISIERILINKEGVAVAPERADELGIKADILFIRDDGFMLGAPESLRSEAYCTWLGTWTHFYDIASHELRPISEYHNYLVELKRK